MSYKEMFEDMITNGDESLAKKNHIKLLRVFKDGNTRVGRDTMTHLFFMCFQSLCAVSDIDPSELLLEIINDHVNNGGQP